MVVGILELTLTFYATSLKDKRSVVKRVIHRCQDKFNVSVAEVDMQDVHTTAVLGFATVGNDAAFLRQVLENVVNFVDRLEIAEVVDQSIQTEHF
jgi:hypothetical protein